MFLKIVITALILFATDSMAAIGDGDQIDFTTIPGEFCNSESDRKQQNLLKTFPNDMGIINVYALYLGLCQLVANNTITEQAASIHWAIERDKLIENRNAISK